MMKQQHDQRPVRLLNPRQLSERLGVSLSVLANWRCKGFGPPYVKIGRRYVGYLDRDVEAWIESRVVTNTMQAKSLGV